MTINGPKTAKVGDTLHFDCETGNSNPRATVQWVVDGRTIHENYTHWVRAQSILSTYFHYHNLHYLHKVLQYIYVIILII